MLPPVAVAVLNWNGFELTRACIRSLASLSTRHHVFVVDNGSDTPEAQRLRSELAVVVVALPHNGGVAYGYNAAICHARELGYPYVQLLNNDVINVDSLMLDQLLRGGGRRARSCCLPLGSRRPWPHLLGRRALELVGGIQDIEPLRLASILPGAVG